MYLNKTIKLFPQSNNLINLYNELGLKTEIINNTLIINNSNESEIIENNPIIIIKVNNILLTKNIIKKYENYKINLTEKNIIFLLKEINQKIFFNSKYEKNLKNIYISLKDELNNKIIIILSDNKYSSIAILTSGGDCQGMNPCLRSIVRSSLKHNIIPYFIYEGYKGLINNNIKIATYENVPSINKGGTYIKSARSPEFLKRIGRIKSTINILIKGINSLVVLGGNGSFKGMEIFHDEWIDNCKLIYKILNDIKDNKCIKECPCEYIKTININSENTNNSKYKCIIKEILFSLTNEEELNLKEFFNKIDNKNKDNNLLIEQLKVVGVPCTIDNDIPLCISLGFDTALHRVIESIDNLIYTISSHNMAFVIEVMGRDCGYIAVMSALAVEANYVLCPEVQNKNWKKELIINILSKNKRIFNNETIERNNEEKKYNNKEIIIILSERAVDEDGKIITVESIKELISPYIETRILRLGHLQRGGRPSGFDRLYGTMVGVKVVESILLYNYSKFVCLYSNQIVSIDKMTNEFNEDKHLEIFNKKEFNILDLFNEEYLKINNKEKWNYKLVKLEDINKLSDQLNKLIKENKYSELLKYRGKLFIKSIESLFSLIIRDELIEQNVKINSNYLIKKDDYIIINNKQLIPFNKFNLKSLNNLLINKQESKQIGIILEGYRCSGMHIALSTIIKYSNTSSIEVSLIYDGFKGLLNNKIKKIYNKSINKKRDLYIGTSPLKEVNKELAISILNKLKEYKITGLIIIGSSATIPLLKIIKDIQIKGPDFIEILLIPLSISSNIPLTTSIGLDTALNSILTFTDILSSRHMTFHNTVNLVELGGKTGYLSMLAGLASGSIDIIIGEKNYTNKDITILSKMLKNKFNSKELYKSKSSFISNTRKTGLLIIRQKSALNHINSSSICELLKSDCNDLFRTEYCVLGPLFGGETSPWDRILSIFTGIYSFKLISSDNIISNKIGLVSIFGNETKYIKIEDICNEINEGEVINKEWLKFVDLCKWLE